jgi:PAS domain-containing protein
MMATQQPLEMILLRQLATHLASPIWILEATGELVFYNEPAEHLLGIQFEEVGPLVAVELTEMFEVTEADGEPLAESDFPVVEALINRAPANRLVRFRAKDGVFRLVEVLAVPIVGQGDRFLGILATFWEPELEREPEP